MNSKIPHCGLYILLGSIPCIACMKCLKWWQIEAVSESLLVRQGWGWPLKYVWLPITSTQESERSFLRHFKRFSRQACSSPFWRYEIVTKRIDFDKNVTLLWQNWHKQKFFTTSKSDHVKKFVKESW